jgi:hypothetical protein
MSRHVPIMVLVLWCTWTLPGCGGFSTSNPGPPPPHGGNIHVLPGDLGLLEIVQKPTNRKDTSVTSEVTFYFYKDAFTPISPTPTKGVLIYGRNAQVMLKPEGDALATPPGPPLFPGKEVDGELSVELEGKTTKLPLAVR